MKNNREMDLEDGESGPGGRGGKWTWGTVWGVEMDLGDGVIGSFLRKMSL